MHPAPVPKGCLISVSRRGAGSGGRDYDLASEMRCKGPAVQAASEPQRACCAPGTPLATVVWPASVRRGPARSGFRSVDMSR
jgi:hypothetical protein